MITRGFTSTVVKTVRPLKTPISGGGTKRAGQSTAEVSRPDQRCSVNFILLQLSVERVVELREQRNGGLGVGPDKDTYYDQTYFWSFRRRKIIFQICPNTYTQPNIVYRRKYYIPYTH